jgi:hypothetical protein
MKAETIGYLIGAGIFGSLSLITWYLQLLVFCALSFFLAVDALGFAIFSYSFGDIDEERS